MNTVLRSGSMFALFLLIGVLVGCGQQPSQPPPPPVSEVETPLTEPLTQPEAATPSTTTESAAKPEETAAPPAEEPSSKPEAVASAPPLDIQSSGKKIFTKNCSACHGPSGEGTDMTVHDGKKINFKDPVWQIGHKDDYIEKIIRSGRGHMPAFEGVLSDDEIKTLVQYLRTLPDRG